MSEPPLPSVSGTLRLLVRKPWLIGAAVVIQVALIVLASLLHPALGIPVATVVGIPAIVLLIDRARARDGAGAGRRDGGGRRPGGRVPPG